MLLPPPLLASGAAKPRIFRGRLLYKERSQDACGLEKIVKTTVNNTISPTSIPLRLIINIDQERVQSELPNYQSYWTNGYWSALSRGPAWYGWGGYGYGGYGWGSGMGNAGGQQVSSMAWSPDARFMAGYLWQQRSSEFGQKNLTNTVGIWNTETGCLVQTFRLPFPDDTDAVEKRTFFGSEIQWSADGKRLLLFSQSKLQSPNNTTRNITYTSSVYDGTALIASVNVEDALCRQDVSDSLWTILPRGALKVENVTFPTLQCAATSATTTFQVSNFSTAFLYLLPPVISGANASDFTIVTTSNRIVAGTRSVISVNDRGGRADFIIRFTPSGTGLRTASMTFADSSGQELETITLTGRRDTFALASSPTLLSAGRMLQFTQTSASVSIRNISTDAILWGGNTFILNGNATLVQNPQQLQVQSVGGRFRLDSISPSRIEPNATARVYVTWLRSEEEGEFRDSLNLFTCGANEYNLVVTASVIPDKPRLEVDSVLSFGRLICEESSTATLILRNTGGKRLQVFRAATQDAALFSAVSRSGIDGVNIPPLESIEFPLRFTPTGVGGNLETTLFINSDASNGITRRVRLVGRKTLYKFEWSPMTVNFGNVPFAQSATAATTFINQGTEPYRWQTLPFSINKDFVLQSVVPNPVPAGATAQAVVRFNGRRDAGNSGASVNLPNDTPCATDNPLTLNASVLEPQPLIRIAETTKLGSLFCEQISEASIPILNDGDAFLRLEKITVEGGDSIHFPSVQPSKTILDPKDSAALIFRYLPRSLGTHTITVLLKTNDINRTTTATLGNNPLLPTDKGNVRITITARKDSVGVAMLRTGTKQSNAETIDENTPLYDTLYARNTGTVPITWSLRTESRLIQNLAASLPISVSPHFNILSVEPALCGVGDSSRIITRFVGGMAGLNTTATVFLNGDFSTNCLRTFALSLRGVVKPEPRLRPIENVSKRLLCENSMRFAIPLQSFGTDSVRIQTVVLADNAQNIFRIVSVPPPTRQLAPRNGRDSIVLEAQSTQVGTFTARLVLQHNAANLDKTLNVSLILRKDSSGIQAIPASIDFPVLTANTPSERSITIANTGSIPQTLPTMLVKGAFTLDSFGANPFSSNSQTQARVRFTGGTGGIVRDTVRLMDSCGRVLAIPLFARVVAGELAVQDSLGLQMGTLTDIPVYLRNRKGLETGMDVRFRVNVMNASLVDIISPSSISSTFPRIGNNVAQRLLFSTNITSNQETEPLLRLRVRSLLGNATTTTIVLDSLNISGGAVQSSDTLWYRTLGINYVGGLPRLIYSPNLQALALAPNPASDELRLRLAARQATPIVVEVIDILGKKQTLLQASIDAGEREFILPTTQLSSGVYAVSIRAGEEQHTVRISIVK